MSICDYIFDLFRAVTSFSLTYCGLSICQIVEFQTNIINRVLPPDYREYISLSHFIYKTLHNTRDKNTRYERK